MTLHKHDFPILEYDDTATAVINPNHAGLNIKLPKKCVFAFLRETVDRTAESLNARIVSYFDSITKLYPIYVCSYEGEEICLAQAPMGAAPAVQIMDWLISYGVKTIISAGSCGVLTDLPENIFLIPTEALRDEGSSYHYLPPARSIRLNTDMIKAIEKTFREKGLRYSECKTWTTDGFYRETADMVRYRKEEGCSVVDMECSALAACAAFRGASFGQIFFTGDSLAQLESHDSRDWGHASHAGAMELCLDILKNC